MRRIKNTIDKMNKMTPVSQTRESQNVKDKYRKYHKEGPQLYLTKALIINGPLTSKQLWRIYQRDQFEKKKREIALENYWGSLTKLKETLKFMRLNEKIVSNGYSHREHIFRGWKIQQKRALKYVHPSIIKQIQDEVEKRNTL